MDKRQCITNDKQCDIFSLLQILSINECVPVTRQALLKDGIIRNPVSVH